MVFPKYISLTKKFGVTSKSKFLLFYKEWVGSKKAAASTRVASVVAIAKQPVNYKNRPELSIKKFELRPIEETFDFTTPKEQQQRKRKF